MPHGTVRHYDDELGHGMIEPSNQSRDVYFAKKVVRGGVRWVTSGVRVTYELYEGDGTPEAKLVKRRT